MNPKAVTPAPFAEPLAYPLNSGWTMFFQGLFKGSQPQYGTTAERPTNPALWQQYGDTTLNKPIWCNQITPSVTWIDATGASV
jgi:hypothetical protein